MFLSTLIACKIAAMVFLFILMGFGYLQTPAVFFSIHWLCFSAALDALTANAVHRIYLSKSQTKWMQFTACFCGTSAIITLYNWLQSVN